MGTGFYFLIPTLPVYIVDVLDAGPGKVGYILAVYTLSAMIIRPLTGYSLDAYGRKGIYLFVFCILGHARVLHHCIYVHLAHGLAVYAWFYMGCGHHIVFNHCR
jgi:MFS family permease